MQAPKKVMVHVVPALLRFVVCFVASFQSFAASAQPPLKSFGYVLQADKLAKSRPEAVQKLARSGRDVIVIDATYDGTSRWTPSDLEMIRAAKSGRKVICYLSVGEAEDYRGYWKNEWDANRDGLPDENAPRFLNAENPDWEGNYKVKYWDSQWQSIILNEVKQIVAQGFDGVYLDIIDGFEFFEYDAQTDEWIDGRSNPETGNTFRDDMVTWVSRIRSELNADGMTRWVIPQNGEALVETHGYLDSIDAMGAEDVFTNGKRSQKPSSINYRMTFLKKVIAANKPVYVIEYPKNDPSRKAAIGAAKAAGFSLLLTDRPLKTLGVTGDSF